MTRALRAAAASATALAVAAAAFALAVGFPASDPDMWWHLASGRWIVVHGRLLDVDIFSSTATGEPFALGEPLGEVILWLAYAAGSWVGVAALRAALVALAAFSVTRLALRTAPARVAVPLAAVALVLSKPTWTDRPQLWTLALFPLVLDLALAARDGSRAARFAVVPIVALWAELHAGYALGIAVLWIFALEALLTRRALVGPLVVAVVATAIVPFEPGALTMVRAIAHVGGSTVRIVEETPVDPLTPFGALFALFVAVTVAALMLRGGSLLAALVIVPTLWLALSAQRHIPLFGFAAVPFVAGPVAGVAMSAWRGLRGGGTTLRKGDGGLAWGAERSGRPSRAEGGGLPLEARTEWQGGAAEWQGSPADRQESAAEWQGSAAVPSTSSQERGGGPHPIGAGSRPLPPFAPALAALLWVGALASVSTAPAGPDVTAYPAAALDAVRASSGVLLNEYDWGGWLIWSAPERPVFVDGRLYPFTSTGVMDAYRRALAVLPGWSGVIDRWGVRQVLLRPDRALVQALRDEGWRTIAEDPTFVLLERPR